MLDYENRDEFIRLELQLLRQGERANAAVAAAKFAEKQGDESKLQAANAEIQAAITAQQQTQAAVEALFSDEPQAAPQAQEKPQAAPQAQAPQSEEPSRLTEWQRLTQLDKAAGIDI